MKENFIRRFFDGRLSRRNYLLANLVWVIALVVSLFIGQFAKSIFGELLMGVWVVAIYLTWISLSLRRLHDLNESGWSFFNLFRFIQIKMYIKRGDYSANKFGDPPPEDLSFFDAILGGVPNTCASAFNEIGKGVHSPQHRKEGMEGGELINNGGFNLEDSRAVSMSKNGSEAASNAKTSVILGILGSITLGIPAIFGLMFGIAALRKIKLGPGSEEDKALAIFGIVFSCLCIMFWTGFIIIFIYTNLKT